MKIIVGLGNIGDKYILTRHNIGFLFLDYLIDTIRSEKSIEVKWKEDKQLKAMTTRIPYGNEILLLIKPTTMMNLSGQAVSHILSFFKEPAENLVVIYDDIDLPLGTVRFRKSGSAGTHNGMKSIIQEIGTNNFPRLRLGIESRGNIAPAEQDLSSFVLSNFLAEEKPLVIESMKKGIEEIKNLT